MTVVRSPVRSVVRSPVRGVFGGAASLIDDATAYLAGIAPLHWFDFVNDRCLYASNDVGGVSGATGYSFSRASTGYYTNADGTLTSFASGALRRGNRGVLIEGARTNLCLRSQEFDNASWSKNGAGTAIAPSVTADAGVAPDGTTTADRVQFSLNSGTATADVSDIRQNVVTTAVAHTLSFWIKSFDGSSTYQMLVRDANGIVNQLAVTGAWTRYVLTATYGATTTALGIGLRGGQTPTNSNTADVLIWGAQLEAASFPSSYIPTTTASATRAADVLTCTAGVSYPLSLWAEFERAVDTGALEVIAQVDTGASTDRVRMDVSAADLASGLIATGGVNQAFPSVAGALSAGVVYKAAIRVDTNNVNMARGGTLGTNDTSVTLPATPTLIRFGNDGGSTYPWGYIRRAAVFNSALTDANLQSVTT